MCWLYGRGKPGLPFLELEERFGENKVILRINGGATCSKILLGWFLWVRGVRGVNATDVYEDIKTG